MPYGTCYLGITTPRCVNIKPNQIKSATLICQSRRDVETQAASPGRGMRSDMMQAPLVIEPRENRRSQPGEGDSRGTALEDSLFSGEFHFSEVPPIPLPPSGKSETRPR